MKDAAHFVLASDANGAISYENPLAREIDRPKRVYQWGVVGPWVVAWGSASARHGHGAEPVRSERSRARWPLW